MGDRVLCGIETEYGLWIEGRGPETQAQDAAEFVRAYPSHAFAGWDYRFESPRSDLRGFNVEALTVDPTDAQFDVGKNLPPPHILRSDRILPNGARFYNDHGHPEYSTPEAWNPWQAAMLDLEGEQLVLQTLHAFQERTGMIARVIKNNTDFSGASYGTHENYLVSRTWGVDRLVQAIVPILVARTLLTGAGKACSESGPAVGFQLSQRADFFMEPINLETLYRRPVFNTRDEPHARAEQWIRLHVIAGDANRMPHVTAQKLWWVTLALRLLEAGQGLSYVLDNPVQAFQTVSRDLTFQAPLPSSKGPIRAGEILELTLDLAEQHLRLSDEDTRELHRARRQLRFLSTRDWEPLMYELDWVAKRYLVETYRADEGLSPTDPAGQAIDLQYADLDPSESLYQAIVETDPNPMDFPSPKTPLTRAAARGKAVRTFSNELKTAAWRSVTFDLGSGKTVELPPEVDYPVEITQVSDVREFIDLLEETQNHDPS